jgi:hypothetical protein
MNSRKRAQKHTKRMIYGNNSIHLQGGFEHDSRTFTSICFCVLCGLLRPIPFRFLR